MVIVGGGCDEADSQKPISIAIQSNPATTARLDKILKEDPQVAVPGTKTEYSIIVVEPDPGVDYKIVKVTPDPTIDYKIIVIDPKSGNELADLSRQFGGALREKLMREKNEVKD